MATREGGFLYGAHRRFHPVNLPIRPQSTWVTVISHEDAERALHSLHGLGRETFKFNNRANLFFDQQHYWMPEVGANGQASLSLSRALISVAHKCPHAAEVPRQQPDGQPLARPSLGRARAVG